MQDLYCVFTFEQMTEGTPLKEGETNSQIFSLLKECLSMLLIHEAFKFTAASNKAKVNQALHTSSIYFFILINDTNCEKHQLHQQPHKRCLSQKPACPELPTGCAAVHFSKAFTYKSFHYSCWPRNGYDRGPGHGLTEIWKAIQMKT